MFPFFREWGATGLLIEWEDTFPYRDQLACIGSYNTESKAYSECDVEQILKLAEASNLAVIPLVQSFGHLEVNSINVPSFYPIDFKIWWLFTWVYLSDFIIIMKDNYYLSQLVLNVLGSLENSHRLEFAHL